MSSVPLTLAEAVPLGTVMLQRLLADADIRSLAIKGPAFVELGVRAPKQSNDIDLLVARDDRALALSVLNDGGWKAVSYALPRGLEDTKYSVTLRHDLMPVTVDLHSRFEGLLDEDAFEVLWAERCEVVIAHQLVTTAGADFALIMEALNAVKALHPSRRRLAAEHVVARASRQVRVEQVASAAVRVGSRHTAADLVRALGGPCPQEPATAEEAAWLARPFSYGRRDLLADTLRYAPTSLLAVLWEQFALTQDGAKFWALTHETQYRNRIQILWLRLRRLRQRRSSRRL